MGGVGGWGGVLSGALPATIVTSLVRRIARTAFLVPCLLICISCAQFPAELAPYGTDKSIIAIKVKKHGFLAWLDSPVILFARLQADGKNRKGDLLISNHRTGGYAYVVNFDEVGNWAPDMAFGFDACDLPASTAPGS